MTEPLFVVPDLPDPELKRLMEEYARGLHRYLALSSPVVILNLFTPSGHPCG